MSNRISKSTPVIKGVVDTSVPKLDKAPTQTKATIFPTPAEAVWNSVKAAANANNGGISGLAETLQHPPSSTLNEASDPAKEQLDSLNEFSEMASSRLQLEMDRRSKFVETLSNVLKKEDATGDGIAKNLK